MVRCLVAKYPLSFKDKAADGVLTLSSKKMYRVYNVNKQGKQKRKNNEANNLEPTNANARKIHIDAYGCQN